MEGGGVEVENGVKQACWRENGGEGNVSGVEPILPMEFANDIYIYIYFSPHDFRFDDFRFVPISLLRYQSLFTLYFSNVNRDVALLGFSRRRGQIDQSPVAMPLPNVQLLVLHRSESDRDLRPGWAGVHQRQAKGAERLVEPELRRQSRAQRHDQDR